MRTLGAAPINVDRPEGPDDLTNTIIDGLESLRQRIQQRLRFPRGTWRLNRNLGTDSIIGHQRALPLVAIIIANAIVSEGGAEITGQPTITTDLDHDTRVLMYQAIIPTIYGRMTLRGPVL